MSLGISGLEIIDISPSEIEINADFDQVFRILLNLVRNAQTADAGSVRIKGYYSDTNVIVDITDDGPGLPDPVKSALFNRDWDISGSGTSGLGLKIAKELVENHGGILELISTGKDGTVFRLSMPQ